MGSNFNLFFVCIRRFEVGVSYVHQTNPDKSVLWVLCL